MNQSEDAGSTPAIRFFTNNKEDQNERKYHIRKYF